MKSILQGPSEVKSEDKKYPYFGIWKEGGLVVLFTSRNVGTVVHEVIPLPTNRDKVWGVGYHHSKWGEKNSFKPLKGKIILSN